MCFTTLGHFTGVLLLFWIIHSIPLSSVIVTESIPLNTSEEIKNIFSNSSDISRIGEPLFRGKSRPGNFAEGGVVNVNGMFPNFTSKSEVSGKKENASITHTQKIKTDKVNSVQNQNKSSGTVLENTNNDSLKNFTSKNQIQTKLNDTGSNLFLGVPEVVHINGTSSIKPRKGVYYNKIVPRKGVDNEIEGNASVITSCFWISEDECYSAEDMHDVECSCCEEGNLLGKKVKEQPVANCKNCTPVNFLLHKKNSNCKSICCKKKLFANKSYSVSTTEDIFDKYLNDVSKKKQNVTSFKMNKINKTLSDLIVRNSTNKFKQKPSITKVPYDVEVMTEIISKAKQKVFVPVIVSIFLLPLVGILIYFFWRRTKDFWEKRYYKKMDFLIDGMYND